MRIKLLAAALLLAAGCVCAQNDDPVLMTINGKDIHKSEFEYSYNKNNSGNVIDKKTVDEYLPMFVNYKLKVEDAIDKKLDQLKTFKTEYMLYRNQQIKPTLINDNDVMAFAYKMYENTREQVGPEGWFMPAHIFVRVDQKAGQQEQMAAKARIDSIYNVIDTVRGDKRKAFMDMARRCSDDHGSSRQGGVLGWYFKGQLLKEFDDRMLAMKVGEISEPFMSPQGYHIMLLVQKRPFESFEESKQNILDYIEVKKMRDNVADMKIDSIVKASNGALTKEQLLDKYADDMAAQSSDFKNLIREYHDGLLLFEASNREIWGAKCSDVKKLRKFFKKNKKRYGWDEPRFKGIAFHTKSEADIEAVKKSIRKVPFNEWAEVLRTTFNNDSVLRIRVEKGIFKKGDNGIVDREVFGIADAKADSISGYPYRSTFGHVMAKGPEQFEDVRSLVVADYQDMLEKQWIADLRKKYKVEIHEEVLRTINNKDK